MYKRQDLNDLIKIGTEIEGHPDNVVPAFLGGFTVSSMEKDKVIYFRQEAYEGFKFAVMYPEFTLSTSESLSLIHIYPLFLMLFLYFFL